MATSDPATIAERIEALMAACRSVLQREGLPGIQAVFLYGSSLERDFRPDSDIDLAVLDDARQGLSWSAQARLMDALERAVGKGVDLRMLRESSPSHQAYVLEQGRLVWATDPHLVDTYSLELQEAARAARERAEQEWPRVLGRLADR
jgi:predicted nucleotidyltransferase